jgi:copper transporter 1
MLMNWKTINTCFISSEWQNLSGGMYAGSVIGVFVLVIALEAVRRAKREYDRKLLRDKAEVGASEAALTRCGEVLPSWPQQVVRATLYGGQFTAAFFV